MSSARNGSALSDAELDTAFRAYKDRVREYGLSWWIDNAMARDETAGDAALLARLRERLTAGSTVETSDVYSVGGAWQPSRSRDQQEITRRLLADDESSVRPGPSAALVVYGAPGAGKSTVVANLAAKGALHLDADLVRSEFDEYANGLGSEVVQTETSHVAYGHLRETALGGAPRRSLVLDLVGDPRWAAGDVRRLVDAGYRLRLLLVRCDEAVTLRRVKERALRSGRYVSPAYVASVGDRPRLALEAALETCEREGLPLDGWAVVDTTYGDAVVTDVGGAGMPAVGSLLGAPAG